MRKRIKRINLSSLTVISITISVLVTALVCIALFSKMFSNSLNENISTNTHQAVNMAKTTLENYTSEYKKTLETASRLMHECKNEEEFENNISFFLNIYDDADAVFVYDEDGNILSLSGRKGYEKKDGIYKNLSFNKEEFLNRESLSGNDGFIITKPHVQTVFKDRYPWVITCAKKIDGSFFNKNVYIALDFDFSKTAKYIDGVGVGRRGYCFVTDLSKNVIYHPRRQLLRAGINADMPHIAASASDGTYRIGDMIYSIETTSDNLWRVVGVSFTTEIEDEKNMQIALFALIAILCCILSGFVSVFILSKTVRKPIYNLMRAMKSFERKPDTITYIANKTSILEIYMLSSSFSHMERRINRLIKRVKYEKEELRKTELKALQAQINPHFLYNTLDSIQWMCELGKTDDAVDMIGALARLFRISISRGKELITIRDEINHAKSYLIIQSYRYKNQFSYKFNVEEGLENYLCNKITLQPLIENAIYHGIDRLESDGKLDISVKSDGGDILLIVSDNGVGMTKEVCESVLEKKRDNKNGIGLKNVNDRSRIYFGKKYGITIKSEPDKGTSIIVRIPKITKEDENEK